MSSRLKSRMTMAGFGLAFASATAIFVFHASRAELVLDLILLLIAVPAGILVSGITEHYFVRPAERFMNLVTGFGTKGQDAEFDEKGVPIVSIRRLGEKFYNPVAVAMAAMRYYDDWERSSRSTALDQFRNCCDSLLENLSLQNTGDQTFGIWEYGYPFSYGLVPPWVSGLAQGVGAQVLSRFYRITGEERYRTGARQVLNSFFVRVEKGGVTYKNSDKEWWYEEFVGEGAQVSRVLNGMIYALLGIREYGENTGDPDAEVLFRRGTACLRKNLSVYDAGWWTYYDALGTVATKSYHAVHVDLIRQMYEATGDEAYWGAFQRWSSYRVHFFLREFIRSRPSWHDAVVLLMNFAGVWLLLRSLMLLYVIYVT